MNTVNRFLILFFSLTLIIGCAENGGDRAEGVEPGPPPSGGQPPADPPTVPDDECCLAVSQIVSNDQLNLAIENIWFNNGLTLDFTLSVLQASSGKEFLLTDLAANNARFTLAQLIPNAGESKGQSWSSYITRTEDPICRTQNDVNNSQNQCTTFTTETDPNLIDDLARKVQDPVAVGKVAVTQATSENNGTWSEIAPGQWRYQFNVSIASPDILLNVHRACVQWSFAASTDNLCIDFIPSEVVAANDGIAGSSLSSGFYDNNSARQIATEQTCNTCHEKLAIHGGGRTQLNYCVTCHNPETIDANSGNSVDLKVMAHKIHFAKWLPSLADGTSYKIWGFRNSEHDYSDLSYPQTMMTCARCHAGSEDVLFAATQNLPVPEAELTSNGHNWVSEPTKSACGSCHEKLFTDNLKLNETVPSTDHTGYTDERNCAGCHRDRGAESPGGLQANQAHRIATQEIADAHSIVINSVTQVTAGELPVVTFSVVNSNGSALDLQDPLQMCATARWDIRAAYDVDTEYYGRIREGGAPAALTAAGNNQFSFTMTTAVPAEVGTLAFYLDFNFPSDCNDNASKKVRLAAAKQYVASSSATASSRRQIVSVEQCNDCHGRFLFDFQKHSGMRAVGSVEACAACHTPEYSGDSRTRDMAEMMHALHAPSIRENAFGIYTTDRIHYPGNLKHCEACHINNSYTLPLSITRRPVKTARVPSNLYTTAVASSCSGCHDSPLAKSHMQSAGGAVFNQDFAVVQAAVESCSVCHGEGKTADVSVVHQD